MEEPQHHFQRPKYVFASLTVSYPTFSVKLVAVTGVRLQLCFPYGTILSYSVSFCTSTLRNDGRVKLDNDQISWT